jgi:hypothetical protein
MRRSHVFVIALAGLGTLACGRAASFGPSECAGPAPMNAGPYPRYDSDSAALFAAEYELIELNLSSGERQPPRRARLALSPAAPTDSLAVLRGSTTWLQPSGAVDTLANGQPFSEAALVDAAGVLHVGCYPCLDGGASLYRIVAAGPSGLWGLWETPINENLMRLSDTRTGRDLPNPAGFFCALRRSVDSSRPGHAGA